MKKVLVWLFSVVVILAADQIVKPYSKHTPKANKTEQKLPKATPHPVPTSGNYRVSVQWVKLYGRGGTLVNFHAVKKGYAFLTRIAGKKNGRYKDIDLYDYQYVYTVIDGSGRRKWEINYEPRKIRYAADFIDNGGHGVYVLGWGGKRLDVWYIEKFDRHDGKGKEVARVVVPHAAPFALLKRNGKFVALGHTLKESVVSVGPHRKEMYGLVVWKVDGDGKHGKLELRRNVTGIRPYPMKRVLGKVPFYNYRKTMENGLILIDSKDVVNAAIRLSPSFMQEEFCENCNDMADAGFDVVIAGKGIKRCDERCRVEKWASAFHDRSWGLLIDGGTVMALQNNGDVVALGLGRGELRWKALFSKTDRYRAKAEHLLKKRGAANEYLRLGYVFNGDSWNFQVMDFKVERKRGSK